MPAVANHTQTPQPEPARTPPLVRLLAAYVRWRARGGLDGVFTAGLDTVRAQTRNGPVLFACTHSAWWDGLLVRVVEAQLGLDGRVTMDGETLALHPYFRWFGVTALYPTGLAALGGLRRLARHLDRPGRCAWYFPQGRHRPTHLRPLGVQPGVEVLARMATFTVIPVSIHYAFRLAPVPTAVLTFGAPVEPRVSDLEAALQSGHARADRWFDGEEMAWDILVPSRVRGTEDGLGGRILQRLFR